MIRFFLPTLSFLCLASPLVAAEEALPRWNNASETALIFSVHEETQFRYKKKAVRIADTKRLYVLWGKDVANPKQEKYMARRRYKSLQSAVFLFCSMLLDNPEEYKWRNNEGSGLFDFSYWLRADGQWTYQPIKPEAKRVFQYEGTFAISLHPGVLPNDDAKVSWILLFDDMNDEILDIQYDIQAVTDGYAVADLSEEKHYPLKRVPIAISGKGTAARYNSSESVPQKAVDQGIALASLYIRSKLPRYKKLTFKEVEQDLYRKPNAVSPGRLALMLTALAVHNNFSREEDARASLLQFSRRGDLMRQAETYTIALYLMAYCEAQRTAGTVFTGEEADELKSLASDLTRRLMEDMDPINGWGYPDNPYNISTGQYALLGLYAANQTGLIETSDKKWLGTLTSAANVFLRQQQKNKDKVPLRNPAFSIKPGDVEMCGWGYNFAYAQAPYGSMTVAGIGSQAILYRLLFSSQHLNPGLKKSLEESINSGLAWMQEHYDMEQSMATEGGPSGFSISDYYHYYYLYGLEKAATLTAVRSMHLLDWYRDLTLHLLSEQYPDGKFYNGKEWAGPDVSTAFGLLVLKNASRQIANDLTLPSDSVVSEGK